jgi:hypothetical protein
MYRAIRSAVTVGDIGLWLNIKALEAEYIVLTDASKFQVSTIVPDFHVLSNIFMFYEVTYPSMLIICILGIRYLSTCGFVVSIVCIYVNSVYSTKVCGVVYLMM